MMAVKVLSKQTLGVGLLLLSGCDVARSMRDDLARIGQPRGPVSDSTSMAVYWETKPSPTTNQRRSDPATDNKSTAAADPSGDGSNQQSANLIGKNESELRTMFGSPNYEEDRAPGKLWRYRDGQCDLDIQLYPDVQTHQFGTLSYEVKSYDNTDEGKRRCVAQLKSRTETAHQ
jgi:hypothetical protein